MGLYFKSARRLQGEKIDFFGQEFNIRYGRSFLFKFQADEIQGFMRNCKSRASATVVKRGTGCISAMGNLFWIIMPTLIYC